MNFKKILVIGGCGYVGSKLVDKLLQKNYLVRVLDLQIYGVNLEDHKNLEIVKGDIRNVEILQSATKNIDAVIHLACISNDPSFELNPVLGKSINLDSFLPLLKKCNDNNVKRFLFASSSSVYGIKNIKDVTEDESLEPITDYSKYKAECEKILINFNSKMAKTIIRPATVCGVSNRLRLDLVVNIITKHAYFDKKIKIFGGSQLRPNIHIMDMVDAYITLLEAEDSKVNNQIYNAGYDNLSLNEIGKKVQNIINPNLDIEIIKTDDNRSYHISSDKISRNLNFFPKKTVEDAIQDIKDHFNINDNKEEFQKDIYYNIQRMQNLKLR
jgi:nucleoside-diphosphate-sugar epimerase